jgi:RecA/RadA recombinase
MTLGIQKLKEAKERAKALEQSAPPPRPKLVPWYLEGEKQAISASWVIKDIIPQYSVGLIVGESGAGKTFLCLELTTAVSEGRDFFTKPTLKSSVLYIAAEGPFTIPGRLHAARRGGEPTGNKVAVIELSEKLNLPGVLEKAMEEVEVINQQLVNSGSDPIGLVVIDTMIAAFAVANWNDASEVSEVFDVMKQIQRQLNATVVGIHHHGKNKERGAAGSHYLKGGSDFMVDVYRDDADDADSHRRFRVAKNRFGRDGQEFHFQLVELPPDLRNGYEYELAFVQPREKDANAKGTGKQKEKLSTGDKVFGQSFQAAVTASGEEGHHCEYGHTIRVLESEVRSKFQELYQPSGADREEAIRRAWKRALKRCEKLGIYREDEWLYQVKDTAGT